MSGERLNEAIDILSQAYRDGEKNPQLREEILLRPGLDDAKTRLFTIFPTKRPESSPEKDPNERGAERAQTIAWANAKAQEFRTLDPRERPQFIEDMRPELRGYLMDQELLELVTTIWQPKERFALLTRATDVWKEIATTEWQSLKEPQLAGLVKNSAHNKANAFVFNRILKAYFTGPQTMEQSADAYYTFASSAVDLMEDEPALKKAAQIGNFLDPAVLPIDSPLREGFIAARFTAVGKKEEPTLRKAWLADITMLDIAKHTGLDLSQIRQQSQEFLNSRKFAQLVIKRAEELSMDSLDLAQLVEQINAASTGLIMESYGAVQRVKRAWPYRVVLGVDDPLRTKHDIEIKQKVWAQATKIQKLYNFADAPGVTQPEWFNVLLPNGFMLTVHTPDQATFQQRDKLLEYILKKHPISQEALQQKGRLAGFVPLEIHQLSYDPKSTPERPPAGEKRLRGRNVPATPQDRNLTIQGKPIQAMYQPFETKRPIHPLVHMEKYGFPTFEMPEEQTLSGAIEDKAQAIYKNKTRFLNRRGYRVSVKEEALRQRGFRYLEFRKNNNDPTAIDVSIIVGAMRYDLKLDHRFLLDTEGMQTNDLILNQSVTLWVLNNLDPLLTHEDLKEETYEEAEKPKKKVVTRIGHFRRESEKNKIRSTVKEDFARYEGRDFDTEVAIWRAKNNDYAGNVNYEKPVEDPEAEHFPLKMVNMSETKFIS